MGWLRKGSKAKHQESQSAHTEERPDADVEHFGKVLGDYGTVLQESSAMTFGKPATMLPFSKSEIKRAILWQLQVLRRLGRLDAKFRVHLMLAYSQLAYFYEDADDAKNAMLTAAFFEGKDPKNMAPEDLARQGASTEFSHAIERFSAANKESEALINELHEATKELGMDIYK